jgi:hypothetical protein
VTPPGIDPRTVQLVVQRLNHYATPGPHSGVGEANYLMSVSPSSLTYHSSKKGLKKFPAKYFLSVISAVSLIHCVSSKLDDFSFLFCEAATTEDLRS